MMPHGKEAIDSAVCPTDNACEIARFTSRWVRELGLIGSIVHIDRVKLIWIRKVVVNYESRKPQDSKDQG